MPLNRPKVFSSFCVLSPWDSPLVRWIPVSEWVLGIRCLSLIMLLNHLQSGNTNSPSLWILRTSFAFSLLGFFSDACNFSNSTISAVRISSSPILPSNKACPGKILKIFVHFEISPLPGGLGHLEDSNSIPWNLTITFHPIQIAIIRLMSLLLLDVQLVQ